MNQSISIVDYLVIGFYFIFILYIGFRLIDRKAKSSTLQYLVGGRQLTIPAFVATLVSTWYGGILGVGEFTYLYGIANWLVFGVPYYLAALLFAFLIAKRARREQLLTIPEQLERAYGKTTSLIGALFVFIMTIPAAYVLMLGILLQFFFGWPLWICVVLGSLFSMIYVLIGGFKSVVRTDFYQFSLMFLGFIIIIVFSYAKYGGLAFLKSSLPHNHFVWHGGQGAGYIIVWFFIALATLVEPAFYQRCFAAKDERVARLGTLISVLFWIGFDFLTTTAGLYARAILPDLQNPVTSYLQLGAKVLPPFILGLFLTGLLATIMSTVDSYGFISALTIGRDYIWRLKNQNDEDKIPAYTRIGLIFTALFSIIIALWGQSVVRIWKDLGSIGTPALLIPVVSSFFAKLRMHPKSAVITMISGALVSGLWILSKDTGLFGGDYLLGVEPIYPGLGITLIIYFLDRMILLRVKE
ncbi:MAG: hypothetical protein GWP06_11585 [Actinobacteria bacterium]|nr:hypothetical protein [Actinomycetota bacterium]